MEYTKELYENILRQTSEEATFRIARCETIALLDEIKRLNEENKKLSLNLELLHAAVSDVF